MGFFSLFKKKNKDSKKKDKAAFSPSFYSFIQDNLPAPGNEALNGRNSQFGGYPKQISNENAEMQESEDLEFQGVPIIANNDENEAESVIPPKKVVRKGGMREDEELGAPYEGNSQSNGLSFIKRESDIDSISSKKSVVGGGMRENEELGAPYGMREDSKGDLKSIGRRDRINVPAEKQPKRQDKKSIPDVKKDERARNIAQAEADGWFIVENKGTNSRGHIAENSQTVYMDDMKVELPERGKRKRKKKPIKTNDPTVKLMEYMNPNNNMNIEDDPELMQFLNSLKESEAEEQPKAEQAKQKKQANLQKEPIEELEIILDPDQKPKKKKAEKKKGAKPAKKQEKYKYPELLRSPVIEGMDKVAPPKQPDYGFKGPAPRTKLGARQKAGNLTASAVSGLFTTASVLLPIYAPYKAYASFNASIVAEAGQEKRRHDLIPGWNGLKYENEDASGEEILADQRRIPTVWAKETAGKAENDDGSDVDPEITVYAKQPKTGSSIASNGMNAGHTFLGLRYTRYSHRTGRKERYENIFGFYPSVAFTGKSDYPSMVAKNVRIPGNMNDDSSSAYTISRRFPAKNDQINAIVKASETYADGGYNVFERNCTTFVKEMVKDYAHLNTGGKIFEEEEMRFSGAQNTARGAAGLINPYLETHTYNKMFKKAHEPDQRYAGYGNMVVTKADLKNYKNARSYLNPVKKGFSPSVTGENMRRLHGENHGTLGSYYYYGNLPVEMPEGKKAHADASNVDSVDTAAVMDALGKAQNALQTKIYDTLPPELRETDDKIPADVNKYMADMYRALIPYSDLYSLISKKQREEEEEAEKKGDNKKKEGKEKSQEDYVSLEDIKKAYALQSEYMTKIGDGFSQIFRGDPRLEEEVTNVLSILSIMSRHIDDLYRSKLDKSLKRSEDLGDIQSELDNKLVLNYDGTNYGISASTYEAYLQMFKTPTKALEQYARITSLRARKEADADSLSDDEEKELEKLNDIDGIALDYRKAHRYMLEKQTYSQTDLDYIFKLKAIEKRGMEGDNLDPFDEGKSAASIYQALVLDKIYSGIKQSFLETEDDTFNQYESVERWLNTFFLERSQSHMKELEMIVRAIRRVTDRHTEETLYTYVINLISNKYLEKVFARDKIDGDNHHNIHHSAPMIFESMMFQKKGEFAQLILNLVKKVMKEFKPAGVKKISSKKKG